MHAMTSLHRFRSIKLFRGAASQRRSSMERINRKTSAVRRQLAMHGRQMQKFSRSMVHAKRDMGGTRIQRAYRHFKRVYHRRGLKHLLLIGVLVVYQFFGAGLFYWLESGAEEKKEGEWRKNVTDNRTKTIDRIMPDVFNNTELVKEHILYLSGSDSDRVREYFNETFVKYELALGIKYSLQKFDWTFWNAMLFAGTVCTTIGYGHLYPVTYYGRWATMIYAIFGIPLVLSILDDMGKLLTYGLKYPWMVVKMTCRRLSQHCTGMTREDMKRLDDQDKQALEIFDLPVPVALAVVIGWIFFSSATFCLFEDWDYFKAFYFFFISLTTIGLGDIVPHNPQILLLMFGYIIVGLSLVSMCVNLIQAKLEQSYNAGGEDLDDKLDDLDDKLEEKMPSRRQSFREVHPNKVTLGVLQRLSSYSLSSKTGSPCKQALQQNSLPKKVDKMCQTLLSIPSPSRHPRANTALINNASGSKIIPASFSFDDVMKLVDTEEGDIIVLSELSREENADASFMRDSTLPIMRDDSEDDIGTAAYEMVLLPQIRNNETSILPQGRNAASFLPQGRSNAAASLMHQTISYDPLVNSSSDHNLRVTLFHRQDETTSRPNRSTVNADVIPKELTFFRERKDAAAEQSEESLVRCFSPQATIRPALPLNDDVINEEELPCTSTFNPIVTQAGSSTMSAVKSMARRFSRTFGIGTTTAKSSPSAAPSSGSSRRSSLFTAVFKRRPPASQSLEPIEQSEYKEIDFESQNDDGDRTPLDPVKRTKSRCKHSQSSPS